VLGYLARYTHRVAITNHRLVAFEHDQVTFRWKDYAHGNKKRMMTLGRKSSYAASCSTSCLEALSASALSGSWPIAGAPLSYPSVSACSPTSRCRTHPQPSLPHRPSPLVSAVPNVPLPWSSSNDVRYLRLGNSRPGAHSLTLPNHPSMPLSAARACAPTAVVSSLLPAHSIPVLIFPKSLHPTDSKSMPHLPPTVLTPAIHLPPRRTNFETPQQTP
jgi:hypothetical protein